VGFPTVHVFAPHERLLLQTMADALALALERTHLRQALDDERAQTIGLERRLQSSQGFSSTPLNPVPTERRGPLACVKAYSESLEQVAESARETRERFLGVINEECDRMAALLGDVNDLSRIEGGECALRLSSVTLRELGAGLAGDLGPVAAARG